MRPGWTRLLPALLQRSLLRYLGALAARGTEVIGKFGLYVLAARQMGGTESGLFFLCLTWVNLASTAARLGLERAMARHVAAELATGNATEARRVITCGLAWTTLSSVLAGIATVFVARPAALLIFHQPELAEPLRIAAFILPSQSLAFAIGFTLIGLGRGVAGQMVQSALPPVLSLCALLAGLRNIDAVLTAYAVSYGACCCLGAGFLLHDWHRGLAKDVPAANRQPADPLPPLRTTAREFFVVELVQSALLSLPVLVLGMFADAVAVSAFSVAFRITSMVNTILVSLAMIGAPAFARHHRLGEYDELRRAERQTRLLSMAVCLPLLAIMMLFPRSLLSLLGGDFTIGSTALLILCLGQVVNTLLPTQDMMLAMTGHSRILQRVNLQQFAVCLVLCAALIPPFRLVGAAWLATICLTQGRIGFALAVRRVVPELAARSRPVAA
jgi:O-antigen/teichoic acid export membrane protein